MRIPTILFRSLSVLLDCLQTYGEIVADIRSTLQQIDDKESISEGERALDDLLRDEQRNIYM